MGSSLKFCLAYFMLVAAIGSLAAGEWPERIGPWPQQLETKSSSAGPRVTQPPAVGPRPMALLSELLDIPQTAATLLQPIQEPSQADTTAQATLSHESPALPLEPAPKAPPKKRIEAGRAIVLPRLPPSMGRVGAFSEAHVKVEADESGRVTRAWIATSSGSQERDKYLLLAVKEMRFTPATWAGKDVPFTYDVGFAP